MLRGKMSEPVLNLLKNKNLNFTVSGRDYLIKCLNPEHEDSNPSLRVDKLSGIAHCFACGWKRNLFKYYGILTNNTSVRVAKLKEKLNDLKKSTMSLELPKGSVPYTKPFRGISSATLKYFGAFYTHDEEKLKDRVVFPLKDITDKTVAFVGRHVQMDAKPRYQNYPSGVTLPCYPQKFNTKFTSVVIVEGIVDMLSLYDKGLHNVTCAFGTQTMLSNFKDKVLPYKVQGITKVYILFDGDKAGKDAAEILKSNFETENFSTEIIVLPDGTDPGDLNQEEVDSIKEYIK